MLSRSKNRAIVSAVLLFGMTLGGVGVSGAEAQEAAGLADLPLTQNGGTWDAGHVQGIAVDRANGFIYYSFTDLLAKYDFEGNLVGTLVGWTGHLGDLALNPANGKLYGSLEYKADEAFYIAVIDVAGVDRIGISAATSPLFQTVHLAEVGRDYAADMDGNGRFDGNIAETLDHRYGASGIDGVAFGPRFGSHDGPQRLTVGYGIYSHTGRSDNDHQVLLQYDVSEWDDLARPLVESAPHTSGPDHADGKYFVRTGNTTYGIQNLAYDANSNRWFMGVYAGRKPHYPNYLMFAFDADARPTRGDLVGVPAADGNGWEKGLLLPLAEDGLRDPATGIRGWNQKSDVGLEPVGDGLFYLAVNSGTRGSQTADIALMRWTGKADQLFVPVMAPVSR